MFERITEAEINERSMANVSTTPGRRTAFGEGGLDAKALKLRFDRLGRYLAQRLNEVFDGMADGNLAKALYIDSQGKKKSIYDFVDDLIKGNVENIRVQTSGGVITLTELGSIAKEMNDGLDTGGLAEKIKIIEGVTLKSFYEDFLKLEDNIAPVKSVNGKTGEVTLSAEDVGARSISWLPTLTEIGAEASGTAATAVSGHNTNTASHNDIRLELQRLAGIIADLLDSDDKTLDEMHEIVAYIKSNKALIDAITTSKVNVADIINNLDTNVSDKPLSAAQGVALKALIDEKGNGSSTESMLGEWVLNDVLKLPTTSLSSNFAFSSAGKTCAVMNITKYSLAYTSDEGTEVVYETEEVGGDGWYGEGDFKTVEIFEEPSAEVSAWIRANGKRKQPVGVDKVTSVDTTWYGTDNIFEEGYGINWDDGIAFLKNGDVISSAAIHQRVPISAGENVTFSYDGESGTIKINAAGGGSGGGTIKPSEGLEYSPNTYSDEGYKVTGIGTCTDDFVIIPTEHEGEPVNYIEDYAFNKPDTTTSFTSIFIPKTVTEGLYEALPSGITVYCEAESQPDGWYIDWNLNNNTVIWGYKLEGDSNNGEALPYELPRIRFANVQDINGEMNLTEYNPFTFTVEIVGGGELKEGDLLQICVRRKYWYKDKESEVVKHKWKLRKVAQREITAEDIGKRFLSINVTLDDVTLIGKWMFRNDRNTSNVDTHSYMYFRIKRVTKWSDTTGEECDAIFSNVEKVAKTYEANIRKLTIK